HIRYVHYGEGDYAEGESAVRSLLAEAGHRPGTGAGAVRAEHAQGVRTPETYFGAARAQGFVNGPIVPGRQSFADPGPRTLPLNGVAYGGTWLVTAERATAARGASVSLRFRSRRVFCVLGAAGGPKR